MKYVWLTDIHLNFIDDDACQKFYQEIVNTECDGVVISGDIAEAPKGEMSGDDWLPYFSSKIIGDVLATVAEQNPEIEFLVLCGHTHSEANVCYDVNVQRTPSF